MGIAAAALAVAVVGTVSSIDSGKNAAQDARVQKKAQRATQQGASLREKRAALRERRIRQGQLEQSAGNTGVSDSSGELGTLGALSTNFAANAGFTNQLQESSTVIGNAQVSQARNERNAQVAGGIANLSMSIFQSGIGQPKPTASTQTQVNSMLVQPGMF